MTRLSAERVETIRLGMQLQPQWKQHLFSLCIERPILEHDLEDLYFDQLKKHSPLQVYKMVRNLPEQLGQFRKNARLGHYAEELMAISLEHIHGYSIHAKNLQLIGIRNTTLGELDFLLIKDSSYIHLEFAYKFYIAYALKGKKELIGPNAKENWEQKRKKLVEIQCQNSQLLENTTNAELAKIPWRPYALVLGTIFGFHTTVEDSEINWACHIDALPAKVASGSGFSLCYSKKEWLFPFKPAEELLNKRQLLKEIQSLEEPVMLSVYDSNGDAMSWGFVLPAGWPKRKKVA